MYIIAELHNQYAGSIATAEQMILQAKLAGAHAAKVQLYDSNRLYGSNERAYLSLTYDETAHLREYARRVGLDFFASFFDEERLEWCVRLDMPILKVASITVEQDRILCEKAIASGRRVFMSLGRWDWKTKGVPFHASNVEYLYCVAQYPALLEDVEMPDFTSSQFAGYSDHTPGTQAAMFAIARGARVLEKHFTLAPSLQRSTEKAHLGAMTLEDLMAIRRFADGMALMRRAEPSR